MLDLCRMQSIPSLPSLPGPLWPEMVAPDWVLSLDQVELNCVLMFYWIVLDITIYIYKNRIDFK